MPDIEKFLEPIPGAKPTGENLYYHPIYDKLKEARRQEGGGPMGAWEREVKTADFKLVIKLAEDALLTKTKDIQIAAWLTEAWIYQEKERLAGLTSGLRLIQGLLDKYWDEVYPQIEEDDLELRAGPLEWFGSYYDPGKSSSPIYAIRSIPITHGGYTWLDYQESRRIGYEAEVKGNDSKTKARNAAIAEKKIPPEEFDKDFAVTKKADYKKLDADAKAAAAGIEEIDAFCRDKFGSYSPSFGPLRKALEEFANVVGNLLRKKLETDPDPPEPVAQSAEPEPEAAEEEVAEVAAPRASGPRAEAQADYSHLAGGQITSSDQATLHILAAAQYIRKHAPANPVSYLVLRALRWGELRATGDMTGLPAPSADTRVALKTYAAGNDWKRVLDIAESAMSSPSGRGWLDLQRYSIRASDELGNTAAAKAMRSQLKALLTEFPQLAQAILSDDTGAANPDTLAWLRKEGLIT